LNKVFSQLKYNNTCVCKKETVCFGFLLFFGFGFFQGAVKKAIKGKFYSCPLTEQESFNANLQKKNR